MDLLIIPDREEETFKAQRNEDWKNELKKKKVFAMLYLIKEIRYCNKI